MASNSKTFELRPDSTGNWLEKLYQWSENPKVNPKPTIDWDFDLVESEAGIQRWRAIPICK